MSTMSTALSTRLDAASIYGLRPRGALVSLLFAGLAAFRLGSGPVAAAPVAGVDLTRFSDVQLADIGLSRPPIPTAFTGAFYAD